jgi:inner membrane protein import complex subunit Tim44-like protein
MVRLMTRTLRFALTLAVLLLGTAPALAQDRDSPGYVPCGCCCGGLFFLIVVPILVFRNFLSELARGRKSGLTDEEILDELPKKRQVMFKGEKVPEWRIAGRSKATKAILKFLSYTDNWFDRKYVIDVADEAIRLVKEAIEARSVRGIERRVTPDLLEELTTETKRLRRDQEVHVFGRVEITDVNVLHVEAPTGKDNHTFTALISAKSKDFVEDEETGEILHGDKKTYAYQEFWTFRRTEKRWLVELIRPSGDLDSILEAKNVLAPIDLEEFSKDADPEFLKEVVAR